MLTNVTTTCRGLPNFNNNLIDVTRFNIDVNVDNSAEDVSFSSNSEENLEFVADDSENSLESSEEDGIPEYICKFTFNDYCTFSNVEINRSYPNWIARSEDPKRVLEKVQFTNSKIEYLTSDLCDSFQDLKEIRLGDVELEEIDDDAFFSCDGLRILKLESNKLKELPDELFLTSSNLTNLNLASNKLTTFNILSLQNCKELISLDLENNYLTTFEVDPETVDFLTKLELLNINTNDLSTLNEVSLLEALPALTRIWINQNEFPCSRVQQMMASFRSRSIKVETSQYLRKRYYELEKVEGINCLPDVSWSANIYKKKQEQGENLRQIVREEVQSVLKEFFKRPKRH